VHCVFVCISPPPTCASFIQKGEFNNSLFSIENKRKEQIVLGFIWLPLGFRWMGMRMFFISLSPFFSSNELKESNEDKIKRCGSSCDDCDYPSCGTRHSAHLVNQFAGVPVIFSNLIIQCRQSVFMQYGET
jgi:hypothetical protein